MRVAGSERKRSITPSVRSVAIAVAGPVEPERERLDQDAADDVLAVVAAADRDRAAEHVREQQHEHQRLQRDVEQLLGDLADVLDVAAREHERVAPPRRANRRARSGVACSTDDGRRAHGRRCAVMPAPRCRSSCGTVFGGRGAPVRVRNTSSSVASRRLRSTASTPAASSARMTSMRRVPSTTGIGGDEPLGVERRARSTRTRCVAPRRRASSSARAATVTSMRSVPMRAFSSSGVPCATVRPWSSTTMSSASWSASSRYCVVRMIVVPSRDEVAQHRPTGRCGCAGRDRWSARRGTAPRGRRRGSRRGRAGGACRPRRSSPAGRRRRRGRGARAARRPGAARRGFDRWCRRPTITRFLRALISPSTVACCAATPMRSRTASGSATTSRPATVARPVGRLATAW